jgi:hypothetical protein
MSEIDLSGTPELATARRARETQAALAAGAAQPRPIPAPAIPDPLSLCVYTTVALLAWIFTPALAAAVFGAVAFQAYWRSWRAGLRRSGCILRDPRRGPDDIPCGPDAIPHSPVAFPAARSPRRGGNGSFPTGARHSL